MNFMKGLLKRATPKARPKKKHDDYAVDAATKKLFNDEEVLAHLDNFKAADTDGNASLDGRELEEMLKEIGVVVTRQQLQELISVVDTDLSGAIEFNEYLNMQYKIASGEMKSFAEMLESANYAAASTAELSEAECEQAAAIAAPPPRHDADFYDETFIDFTVVPLLLRSGLPYMQANGFAEECKAHSDGGCAMQQAMRGPAQLIAAIKLDLAVSGVELPPSVERSISGDPFWDAGNGTAKHFIHFKA